MQVFLNKPRWQLNTRFADSIVWRNKSFVWKGLDTTKKNTVVLHTLFVENERKTSKLKYGGMFLYEVEGHM